MKKIIFITVAMATVVMVWYGCKKDDKEELPGSIYGVITDKATGEPIRAAGVQLSPTGTTTVTGNEGQYEFTDLKAGDYTISVTKTGYASLNNYKISVAAGRTNKGDVQIEKLPAALRVVDGNGLNIDILAFGSEASLVSRSFNIFNDSPENLEWIITNNCEWITLSKTSGTLQAGKQQPIVLTIDRDKLGAGDNTYVLNISSDNGTKELTIKATGTERGLAKLNTLEVSNIAATTATFNGVITATGLPAYTERGFVYSISSMPTVENTITKITVAVTENTDYSAGVSNLTLNQTYYVRAYAINREGTAYSTNEVSFKTAAIMPTLTTQTVTNLNIAAGTATFNGTIGTIGDPAYTERGFVYGSTSNPTIANFKKVAEGTGSGAYSLQVTEITEGNTYYVRAYATNAAGTVYGDQVSFVAVAGMPEISTKAVTNINIGAGTATFNGTIESVGDLPYTERGFVYGTTHNPTISDKKEVATGTGTGQYSLNVSKIAEGYTYYVRAYVTNNKGTVYGEEMSFVFTAILPTLSTQEVTNINIGAGIAAFNGTIESVGDLLYTERGFVYSTTPNPTTDDTKKTVSGTGTGAYSANISNLVEGNIYYVRAYVTNSKNTYYGTQVTFDFKATLPSVSTQAVTNRNVVAGTAIFNGTIVNTGDPAYIERGFIYGTMPNPIIEEDTKRIVPGINSIFAGNITSLQEGTLYYIRAYAANAAGIAYGNEVTLQFDYIKPQVSTQAVTKILSTSATLNGNVLSAGDFEITERGFVYSINENPTIDDTRKIVAGYNLGTFYTSVTDLAVTTKYYVRAYIQSSQGIVYGNQVSFTTITDNVYILEPARLMVQKEDVAKNTMTWSTADVMCKSSILDGYTNWRLPTKDELEILYNSRFLIGGFVTASDAYYWSSTDDFNGTAPPPHWFQNFNNGIQGYGNYDIHYNSYKYYCRCVRTIE